jgi:death on curing protein
VRYLTRTQILLIHSVIIDETGGLHGVRDHHAMLSLELTPRQKVFNKELFPTIFDKAAVYVRDILMNHPFLDGNKRTAMTAASVFLQNNGLIIDVQEGEIVKFALGVVSKRLDVAQISQWFKKHSKKYNGK